MKKTIERLLQSSNSDDRVLACYLLDKEEDPRKYIVSSGIPNYYKFSKYDPEFEHTVFIGKKGCYSVIGLSLAIYPENHVLSLPNLIYMYEEDDRQTTE